jgi:hypothetical protein
MPPSDAAPSQRSRPPGDRVRPDQVDAARAEQGAREALAGELVTASEADLERWAETGEWPASSS